MGLGDPLCCLQWLTTRYVFSDDPNSYLKVVVAKIVDGVFKA